MILSQKPRSWHSRFAILSIAFLCVFGALAIVKAQTTADPLATALANAGLDPTQSAAYAAALELTFAGEKAIVATLTNGLAAVQSQVNALPQSQSGTCVLAAGSCTVVFSLAFKTAPAQCQVTPTNLNISLGTISLPVAALFSASTPTVSGFTINSTYTNDIRKVGWFCE